VRSDRPGGDGGASPGAREGTSPDGERSSVGDHDASSEGAGEMDRGTSLPDRSSGNLDMGGGGSDSKIEPRGGGRDRTDELLRELERRVAESKAQADQEERAKQQRAAARYR
jgi:hypothetical protein